jgi:hypothetical protein
MYNLHEINSACFCEMYIWNINLLDGHISFGNIQQCLPHSVKSRQGNDTGKGALE